ncbi:MAG: pilus assembly protein [Rickettsiales bacterium]|nr:pilus assembly protein [Rickettsiales bacterium]
MLERLRPTSARLRAFRQEEEGLAFLEFAITIPFLMALLLGGVEITRYILITQKVEKVAVTISDVVSQGSTISTAGLNSIITAAQQVMLPYSFGANGYVIVTSVRQTGAYTVSNPPRVAWQYGGGGTWTHSSQIGTPGTAATLPNNMTLFDKDNLIVTEVFYNFRPIIGTQPFVETNSMYKVGVFKPRLGDLSTLSALPAFWQYRKGAWLL